MFNKVISGLTSVVIPLVMLSAPVSAVSDNTKPTSIVGNNLLGKDTTISTAGYIDLDNTFFKSLGTNGRSCASCHIPTQGWTITPQGVQDLFKRTNGLDPLFRLVDGANSPNAPVSTIAERRSAYSMLLKKANIRVGIGIPENAEFELVDVVDPYGFASENELSLFRRPMPTTNLNFISAVMWDGRETTLDPSSTNCILDSVFNPTICFSPIPFDLSTQANHATLGHAEAAAALTQAEQEEIVAFEMGLFTTQTQDKNAGNLTDKGALGSPANAMNQTYYFGINDTLVGDYVTQQPFNPVAMSLYNTWNRYVTSKSSDGRHALARAAIARGQALFNTKLIQITDVKGINDDLNIPVLSGTCTTCHNAPNAGNHSTPMPLDIGISDPSFRAAAGMTTSDMPLYTLRKIGTDETIETTDPGRALITGKWKDIGRFKGPVLRSVASRPPYFHDGSAKDLPAVVNFYNVRFGIGLNAQEKADLAAFLATL